MGVTSVRMFLPTLVLLVFSVSTTQCCEIYYAIYGPEDPNLIGAYFVYLNISELGAAALHNNYTTATDLFSSCDVNSRAFFYNPNIGWYFDDVPVLTLAL